ncbi:MAG TPA: hypothetical protein VF544_06680 [Pyrinomonadaceae bacterium]|jgi:hypothetical protein
MQETKDRAYCAGRTVCDALRFLGDASYAVLPRDVAHQLAELKKNLLGGVRWAIEKNIEWIEARVAGGDRLREEWQRRNATHTTGKETAGSGI